jgi:hypothetical protein
MAHQLIHQLRRTLAETCLPVFSSDGLKLYFYALTAHFGQWSPDAGQAKRIWCALPGLLYAQVQSIQTAFIERVNLTLRRSLASLTRRSWSLAHLPGELRLHIEWWRAYYHFVRPHQALRQKLARPRPRGGRRLAQRYQSFTPAMALGLTPHRWTVLEVLNFPLPNCY